MGRAHDEPPNREAAADEGAAGASAKRDPAPTVRYRLAIFDDHLRSIDLPEGTLVIGRSRHNQLTLHDHLLSRKHCSVSCLGGRVTVVDLNSSNGTFVNGERISQRELSKDDIIELGKAVLVLLDGQSWERGEGLVNLRNPVKAQELIQRLREGSIESVAAPSASGRSRGGVRPQKGLTDGERGSLRAMVHDEPALLADLITRYLCHKLVSLLVRNSEAVRSAVTSTLEEMLEPGFAPEHADNDAFERAVRKRIEQRLRRPDTEVPAGRESRDLLAEEPAED